MFCFDPSNPLLNAVLEIVAEAPSLPVRDLHARIEKDKRYPVTIQHLYRIVNRLIEAQMLLKEKGNLTLNRIWLSQLGHFAASAAGQLEKDQVSSLSLPLQSGQHVVIRTDSLLGLQAMWYHTLAQLYTHLKKQPTEIVKYYSHAWWLLGNDDSTEKFLQAVSLLDISCYWLIGNKTAMDTEAVRQYKHVFPIRAESRTPFPSEGYCVNVFGEYILECIFPKAIAMQFHLLFSGKKVKREDSLELLKDLSGIKARYSMKFWRNAELAQEIRSKVKRYFT
ncbi:hypothetical protein EXS65_04060 [Candidatus Peribacteria bacterium]|nr:hypothetical protein [Candidatus Peribacteria bacterium]